MHKYFIMTKKGKDLQKYNIDIVKLIEELKQKKENNNTHIQENKDKKTNLENQLRTLTSDLAGVNKTLTTKESLHKKLLSTIQKTEQAYMNILESSLTLLNTAKEENKTLV